MSLFTDIARMFGMAPESEPEWHPVPVAAIDPLPMDVRKSGVIARGFSIKPKPLYRYRWKQGDWVEVRIINSIFQCGAFYRRGEGCVMPPGSDPDILFERVPKEWIVRPC